jgi:hypothetical protein
MSLVVNYSIWFGYIDPRHRVGREVSYSILYCLKLFRLRGSHEQEGERGRGTAPFDVDAMISMYSVQFCEQINIPF